MAFAAIAALSSCSQEEEFTSGNNQPSHDEHVVTFGTYLGQAPETRATVIDTEALKKKKFGVFAYYTKQEDYASEKDTANFMYNQEVKWESDAWTYSPLKYWPNNDDDKVSFFAYAPYTETSTITPTGTNITAFPPNNAPSDPVISFAVAPEVDKQIDLLYSNPNFNLSKKAIDEKVPLEFSHALSRIGFKAKLNVNDLAGKEGESLTSGTKVIIKSIKLKSSQLNTSGKFNLYTRKWSNTLKEEREYELVINKELSSQANDGTETASEKDGEQNATVQLTENGNYLMLIPNDTSENGNIKVADMNLTINYEVETIDTKLNNQKSTVSNNVTEAVTLALGQGKAYNFVIEIGLTSAKLSAVVDSWDKGIEGSQEDTVHIDVNYQGTVIFHAGNEKNETNATFDDGNSTRTYKVTSAKGFTIPELIITNNTGYTLLCWSTDQHEAVTIGSDDYGNVNDALKALEKEGLTLYKKDETITFTKTETETETEKVVDLYPIYLSDDDW